LNAVLFFLFQDQGEKVFLVRPLQNAVASVPFSLLKRRAVESMAPWDFFPKKLGKEVLLFSSPHAEPAPPGGRCVLFFGRDEDGFFLVKV